GAAAPLRLGLLRLHGLRGRRDRGRARLVRRALPEAAGDRLPRPVLLLPPLRLALGPGGRRDGAAELGRGQPAATAAEHPADARPRRPRPAQGQGPRRRGSQAPEAVASGLEQPHSKRRTPGAQGCAGGQSTLQEPSSKRDEWLGWLPPSLRWGDFVPPN